MIQEFITRIKDIGLARTNRYKVTIGTPDARRGSSEWANTLKDVSLLCDAATLPGINVESMPHRIYGESREMPYGVSYQPITLNFYMDAPLNLKRLFDDWVASIIDPVSRSIGYYDDYRSNILIEMVDVQGIADVSQVANVQRDIGKRPAIADRSRYKIELVDAWPKTVGDIPLNLDSREVAKLPVTFQYKYWKPVTINETVV